MKNENGYFNYKSTEEHAKELLKKIELYNPYMINELGSEIKNHIKTNFPYNLDEDLDDILVMETSIIKCYDTGTYVLTNPDKEFTNTFIHDCAMKCANIMKNDPSSCFPPKCKLHRRPKLA